MLYPIHGTDKATGINTIAEGRSVCFLCMGHGKIHQLKNQLFERGEIALPRNGYYMPKEGGEICKS